MWWTLLSCSSVLFFLQHSINWPKGKRKLSEDIFSRHNKHWNWGWGPSWKKSWKYFFPVAHSGWVQELFLCLVFDDWRGLTIVTFVLVNEETWSLCIQALCCKRESLRSCLWASAWSGRVEPEACPNKLRTEARRTYRLLVRRPSAVHMPSHFYVFNTPTSACSRWAVCAVLRGGKHIGRNCLFLYIRRAIWRCIQSLLHIRFINC